MTVPLPLGNRGNRPDNRGEIARGGGVHRCGTYACTACAYTHICMRANPSPTPPSVSPNVSLPPGGGWVGGGGGGSEADSKFVYLKSASNFQPFNEIHFPLSEILLSEVCYPLEVCKLRPDVRMTPRPPHTHTIQAIFCHFVPDSGQRRFAPFDPPPPPPRVSRGVLWELDLYFLKDRP